MSHNLSTLVDTQFKKTRAKSLWEDRKYPEFVVCVSELQQDDPNDHWAFEEHVLYLTKRTRNYREAVRIAERGLEYNPRRLPLKRMLAEALGYLRGEEPRAEAIFQELQKSSSGHEAVKVLATYGNFLIRQNRAREAQRAFRAITEKNPDDRRAWQDLARALRIGGDYTECLKVLNANAQPDDPYWLKEKAHCYIEMENVELSKPLLEQARFFMAEIYQHSGDFDRAEQYLTDIGKLELLERGRSEVLERRLAQLEQQRLEQQTALEQANRLAYLGTMATATAHEINQPIGIIRAATDAALQDYDENLLSLDEIKPLLEKVLAQTDRLKSIIENFRRFARGDRSQKEIINVNNVVSQTAKNFVEQFKQHNVDLVIKNTRRAEATPKAWANPYQLEEVLINLLTNARDAVEGRKKATVWVEVRRLRGGRTQITVEDNGPGVSNDYKEQMFVPFVSTKPTEKGTGLGLYISKRIISDLGGKLYYQDRYDGGARFVVELPPVDRKGEPLWNDNINY